MAFEYDFLDVLGHFSILTIKTLWSTVQDKGCPNNIMLVVILYILNNKQQMWWIYHPSSHPLIHFWFCSTKE